MSKPIDAMNDVLAKVEAASGAALASQEYARRFQNKSPDDVGEPAFKWLSRGLFEAFESFVARANGAQFGLFGAIYEFQWPDAPLAIKAAAKTGADVHILYDGIPGSTGPVDKNEVAIAHAKIKAICKPRTTGKIMPNKFFVLTNNNKPVAVWTGSTNFTENGIFGHLNCGHIVEDVGIAARLKSVQQRKDSGKTKKGWCHDNTSLFVYTWVENCSLLPIPNFPGASCGSQTLIKRKTESFFR